MTDPNEPPACSCDVAALVDDVLQAREIEPCPIHRPTHPPARANVALNDRAGLTALIGAHLGAMTTDDDNSPAA